MTEKLICLTICALTLVILKKINKYIYEKWHVIPVHPELQGQEEAPDERRFEGADRDTDPDGSGCQVTELVQRYVQYDEHEEHAGDCTGRSRSDPDRIYNDVI